MLRSRRLDRVQAWVLDREDVLTGGRKGPVVASTASSDRARHELRRLGRAGGDLDGIEASFSPGVDDRASFEEALLAHGIRCHLADASGDGNHVQDERSTFIKKYLGVANNGLSVTADRWIDDAEPGNGDLLLHLDIEGAEWPVLLNISDANLALSSDRARVAATS
jgi:hypothetical protein